MKINVLNRFDFKDLMITNNITKDNVGDLENTFLISINDTQGIYSESYFEGVKSDNLLVLHFDDTTSPLKIKIKKTGEEFISQPMTEDQGKEIISFFKSIRDKIDENTQLIVHCSAGQNRSGSVGKFAVDFFEYDMGKFNRDNPMVKGNSVVTRTLNNLWMWSHYMD